MTPFHGLILFQLHPAGWRVFDTMVFEETTRPATCCLALPAPSAVACAAGCGASARTRKSSMPDPARKAYGFTLPADEAALLDENIALMRYAFPELSEEDALVAILRRGSEDIARQLERMHATQADPFRDWSED
jgi:hypothetical protein